MGLHFLPNQVHVTWFPVLYNVLIGFNMPNSSILNRNETECYKSAKFNWYQYTIHLGSSQE